MQPDVGYRSEVLASVYAVIDIHSGCNINPYSNIKTSWEKHLCEDSK